MPEPEPDVSSECLRELRGLRFGANLALRAAMKFDPTPPGPQNIQKFKREKFIK